MENLLHPSHEEIHEHVNPHIRHNEVHPKLYQIGSEHAEEKPLKSKFRLDWIFTKIKIGGFYPFPMITIIFLAVFLVQIILLGLGIKIPFTIVDLPFLQGMFEYLGIYNHKDLLVISTWVYWLPIFIATIFVFKRLWC